MKGRQWEFGAPLRTSRPGSRTWRRGWSIPDRFQIQFTRRKYVYTDEAFIPVSGPILEVVCST